MASPEGLLAPSAHHFLFHLGAPSMFRLGLRDVEGLLAERGVILLSYELSSSCAKLEQLPGTAFMPGSGGGRTVPLLVIADRARVWSPPSFLSTCTTDRQAIAQQCPERWILGLWARRTR